jgi:hypothetical protein
VGARFGSTDESLWIVAFALGAGIEMMHNKRCAGPTPWLEVATGGIAIIVRGCLE